MGAKPYELPSSEGLISETNIKSTFKESIFNEVTKKYEEVEKESSLGAYKGGNILGWNLFAKVKCKIKFYDNVKEAKGINYGPISINEHESIRDWFGAQGIGFKEAVFMKVEEGEAPIGVIFCDIE